MMRRALVVLASFVLFAACDSEEPSTQVMLEIDADDAVRARMETLRILIAVSDDGGETFRDKLDKTFSEGSGGLNWRDFGWPARLGLVPEGGAVDRLFSVRVHAIDDDEEVFVWQQAVAGFDEGRTTVLRMRLSSACDVALLTCGDPECIGADGCTTCNDGQCIEVEILSELPDYDPSVQGDGAVDFDGSLREDGSMPPDSGADAGDGAMPPEDAGGDGQVEDAGSDAGCTDCDAEVVDPLTASVSDEALELDAPIEIVFNAELDSSTVNAASVSVSRGDDMIEGELEVDGNTVTFTPDAALSPAATYRIDLSSDIAAEDGRTLEMTVLDVSARECVWTAVDVAEGDAPHIASAPQGFTVLAYQGNWSGPSAPGIWVSTRAPGAAWDTPDVVTPDGGGLPYFQSRVSVNDAGEIGVAHYYDTDGYLYASRRTSAGVWSTGSVCTQSVPHVYFDNRTRADGTHDFVCMIDGDVSLGASTLSGAGTAGPVITGYREGSILVWSEGAQMRSYTTVDSMSRNAPTGTTERSGIAIDADPQNGSAVVLWEQTDPAWPNVWSARIVDDGSEPSWSAALRVSNDTSAASKPRVAVDARGRALAVWLQGAAASARVHAALLVPGNSWDEHTPLSDPDKGAATNARIVIEPGGNAFALWISDVEAGAEVWTARYVADVGWQLDDRQRLSREGFESIYLEAAMDDAGRAHATWREGTLIRTASCE